MLNKLAINGGTKYIQRDLPLFKSIGSDELEAVTRVINSGVLSAYIGAPGTGFMGGVEVQAFEEKAAKYFGVKHAIGVNSWTSGLIAAVGAIGIEPGDEIITTPWTMAATATAILHFNGIPVFADIDPESYNIDPECVERLITARTKAIMTVDIFGQSSNIAKLSEICKKYNLKLLCDTAQAPGALYQGKYAGTLADIGGYSLNYHKHIHCGEGGILVTNDDRLAQRLRLIRNHAEAVIKSDDPAELCNMLWFNFRMGELEAAIASVQLDKLMPRVKSRQDIASALNNRLSKLKGLITPKVSEDCTHVYYVYGLKLDTTQIKVTKSKIVDALKAEGVPGVMNGYQNLHRLPMFVHKVAYGRHGFPWSSPYASNQYTYGTGLCPIAEDLHDNKFFGLNLCMFEFYPEDVELVIGAFEKVWANLEEL